MPLGQQSQANESIELSTGGPRPAFGALESSTASTNTLLPECRQVPAGLLPLDRRISPEAEFDDGPERTAHKFRCSWFG